ncbi:prepilin-type processing-associated H-X9-DG protein [Actinopolyspora lacussalsi]|nr:prepilin-type processing-associated H-X9-DG protein [Actinopolyspora lacussalsi]
MLSGSDESTSHSSQEVTAGTGETTSLAESIDLECCPKVFALLERTDPESGELELYAWGVKVGGSANVFRADGHVLAHCGSAEGARRMFGIIRDVVLVWPEETNLTE